MLRTFDVLGLFTHTPSLRHLGSKICLSEVIFSVWVELTVADSVSRIAKEIYFRCIYIQSIYSWLGSLVSKGLKFKIQTEITDIMTHHSVCSVIFKWTISTFLMDFIWYGWVCRVYVCGLKINPNNPPFFFILVHTSYQELFIFWWFSDSRGLNWKNDMHLNASIHLSVCFLLRLELLVTLHLTWTLCNIQTDRQIKTTPTRLKKKIFYNNAGNQIVLASFATRCVRGKRNKEMVLITSDWKHSVTAHTGRTLHGDIY